MNVGLMQIAEIFCPVMTKIKYMCATTRACTQCPQYVSVIIEPFWSFCVINMPKRLFFLITGSEHDETISAGVYHKCYQRRLRGACAFVQSRRVTQSFGVDEESRHLRTPTN